VNQHVEVAIRIRALQGMNEPAHLALVNWGRWSRDRHGIFPPGITPPGLWNQALPSKFGDFADEEEGQRVEVQEPAKAEAAEKEPYDEKAGTVLDERVHHPSFPQYLRDILKVAYVTREVPEDQFPRLIGCTEDSFCERLEACLKYVGRFV